VWVKVLQKKFSILAISRSGYGRTPVSMGRNLDDHADAIVELLDELDLGRVGVLALSGGGPLAMALARKHSSRIWAMLLVSAVSHKIIAKVSNKTQRRKQHKKNKGKTHTA
jgi:pimeloyl-ACP methyl ester carboxylesterase